MRKNIQINSNNTNWFEFQKVNLEIGKLKKSIKDINYANKVLEVMGE